MAEKKPIHTISGISAPDAFNFNEPSSWEIWCKRFQRYMSVSGLAQKSELEKIDVLLYVMGQNSEAILLQFEAQPTTLQQTLEAFSAYFAPQKNLIFERFKFNSRKQNTGETIESFITDLHSIAEKCEFGQLKEELIRDRIVVGMSDVRVSEAMQLKSTLTLKTATEMARQAELTQHNNRVIRSAEETSTFNYVQNNRQILNVDNSKKCYFCNQFYHPRESCPAKTANCRKCGKTGHYQVACKSTTKPSSRKITRNSKINNMNSEEETNNVQIEQNDAFIGLICNDSTMSTDWCAKCFVKEFNTEVMFLIDTGAGNVSIPDKLLPQRFFKSLRKNVSASGPDGSRLNVLGSINLTISCGNLVTKCEVYVIKNLRIPLLGRDAIKGLNLIQPGQRINFIQSNSFSTCTSSQMVNKIIEKYPSIFNEMGQFKGEVKIKLNKNVIPFVQSVPRPVPIPYLSKLKDEIERLQKLQIIEPMHEVTDWVSPIVVVPKNNGEIRLCVDYTRLNQSVGRPYYPIPKIETILANLKGARFFSKLDANKGFYQIKLDRESQLLTCFICPFGRFVFTRLPFGISCAPEYFVSKYNQVLEGITNIVSHVDDILVYGNTIEEHDRTLDKVLSRLSTEGITLNRDKCVFRVEEVKFVGHLLSSKGISIDPDRTSALMNFPTPENKTELLRFLGMINFIGKFIKNRSNVLEPLNALLQNDVKFTWSALQDNAFKKIKDLICTTPMLAYYDPEKKLIVSADASSYGIGACLIQESTSNTRELVAYISRTLTSTERHYAQIEREALGITWAAEKLAEYITGVHVTFETDHKPLVQLLQTKNLDTLTPRLQRFRMRLMRYQYEVTYVPGKTLLIADALSRSPIPNTCETEELTLEVSNYVNNIILNLPVKDPYLEKIKAEQNKDDICTQLRKLSIDGWPDRSKLSSLLLPYFQYRFEISLSSDDLLLKGTRLVIPNTLQKEVIDFLHAGHQGITKCRKRAQSSVWWLGLSTQLEHLIRNCPNCIEERVNPKEPFIKEQIPTRPMEKIAVDFFKKHQKWYIIITDYFSRYFEISTINSMTEDTTIQKLKEYFSRYGICDYLRSDNGPQFGEKLKRFASEYHFVAETSSPYYSQSNGAVEAAVKVAKNLIAKNSDVELALLNYRVTPLANGFSPGELMMGRRLKSHVPVIPSLLKTTHSDSIAEIEGKLKNKSAENYNKRHKTKILPELKVGERVWITDIRKYGSVIKKLPQPRSYLVKTNHGVYRRNRWHLIPAPFQLVSQPNQNALNSLPQVQQIAETNDEDNVTGTQDDATAITDHSSFMDSESDYFDSEMSNEIEAAANSSIVSQPPCTSENHILDEVMLQRTRSGRISRRPGWLREYCTDYNLPN